MNVIDSEPIERLEIRLKCTSLTFTHLRWIALSGVSILIGLGVGGSPFLASLGAQENERQATVQDGQETRVQIKPEATSLLGTPLYRIQLSKEQQARLEENLSEAQAKYEQEPGQAENAIWLGRRLAYLWRYREAVDIFTQGIEAHPQDARLLRHRGHRYITLRQFDKAIADLEEAAKLIRGTDDEVEPDGAPNAAGIPTSTLHTNIWYHLGLAYYLTGDFESALRAYEKCLAAAKNNDMKVATLDWMYMTLRRLGKEDEADELIDEITPELKIIENFSYHRRILMYRGLVEPEELLSSELSQLSDLDLATQGYGVANWYRVEGEAEKANDILNQVIRGRHWSAFGYIAAEADLARDGRVDQSDRRE